MSDDEATASANAADNQPIQVIETVEYEHVFKLNEVELTNLLCDPAIADMPVAVVSVAGAFRKGKSFLLNFFIRYMRAMENSGEDGAEQWLTSFGDKLDGFSWRGGGERDTNGILLWRHPFIVRRADGTKLVVLLMDTQGAFDSQSTVKDCATVFALSTMLSSVQLFNLSSNIQEDDLQHLQLFTEYGRLALSRDDSTKPFQSLLFLVRDWSFPYECEYGFVGGQRLLDRRLQINPPLNESAKKMNERQHPELQQLRQHIHSCFTNIQGFLMPHPGLRVATNPNFRGQLNEIEAEFQQNLRALVPRILHPNNLVLKQINNKPVTCRELLYYFKSYTAIFQGEELPEPKTMLLATAEANNLAAVASAKAMYCRAMEEICGGHTPYMAGGELGAEHERLRSDALRAFKETRKMGGDDFALAFLEQLDEELTESYENFVKVNESKNLFRSMRTPAVMFVLLVISYVLQEIFQLLYLNMFATVCSTLLGGIILTMFIWAYARYSGSLRDAGQAIDDLATWLWDNVLKKYILPAAEHASRGNPYAQAMLAPLTQEGVKTAVNLHRKLNDHQVATAVGEQRKQSTRQTRTPSYSNRRKDD